MSDKSIKNRVLVAMSGGVDSSVAAAMLQKKGYDCVGVYLNFWSDPGYVESNKNSLPTNKCCSVESLTSARIVAHKLNIPFYVLDVRDYFKKNIVKYFIDTYKICKTPNPCVECNRLIKFGYLLNHMKKLKCDFLATGHYAQIKKTKKNNKTIYSLYEAEDENKDQSYFLYTLNQDKLKHIIFPLGEFQKEEIKKIAKKMKLDKVIPKRESQGVCFFPDRKYHDFLRRKLPRKVIRKGNIVNVEGDVLGEHDGLQFYTIGQRKGIEIGGPEGPYYVIDFDFKKNNLIVGKKTDLYKDNLKAVNLSFVEKDLKDGKYEFDAKIRYRNDRSHVIINKNKDIAAVKFVRPATGITSGQSIVFYKGKRVIGGGIIV